jgi:hypothetical protein
MMNPRPSPSVSPHTPISGKTIIIIRLKSILPEERTVARLADGIKALTALLKSG